MIIFRGQIFVKEFPEDKKHRRGCADLRRWFSVYIHKRHASTGQWVTTGGYKRSIRYLATKNSYCE